jgi:hypothetical protein
MEKFELISAYLNNELSESAKADFEMNIKNDPQLAEDLEIYKAIESNMAHQLPNKEAEFIAKLNPLQEQYFNASTSNTTAKSNGKVRKIIFTALSAAAVLALVFILVKPGSSISSKDLYAQYAIHETINNTNRGGASTNIILEGATNLYNAKNYVAAIPMLEQIKDSSAQALFMLGVTQLETNKFNEALNNFESLSKGSSIFADKAKWYIALTHLKNDDKTAAKTALKNINEQSDFSKQAKALAKKL